MRYHRLNDITHIDTGDGKQISVGPHQSVEGYEQKLRICFAKSKVCLHKLGRNNTSKLKENSLFWDSSGLSCPIYVFKVMINSKTNIDVGYVPLACKLI